MEITFLDLVEWEEIETQNKSLTAKEKLAYLFANMRKKNEFTGFNDEALKGQIDELLVDNQNVYRYYLNHKSDNYYNDVWRAIPGPTMDGLVKGLSIFSEKMREVSEMIKPSLAIIQLFEDVFKNISWDDVVNERVVSWANYGWCFGPFGEYSEFTNSPNTMIEANDRLLKYYDEANVKELLSLLEDNYSDLVSFEELNKCFNLELYEACIMIVYSKISFLLYKLGNKFIDINSYKSERNKTPRLTEKITIKDFKNNRIDFKSIKQIRGLIKYKLLMSTLHMYFKDGNGFIKQPSIPNRNFVLHGMYGNKITRIDCIKLLICLYDLCEFVKFYQSDFENEK